jgi:DNA-binding transcriptional LysR family regulator
LAAQGAKRFVFTSNSNFALQEAVEQGQGIALMSAPQVVGLAPLVRLETDCELPSIPVYLAFHRELRSVKRVRLVLDALEAEIRSATA